MHFSGQREHVCNSVVEKVELCERLEGDTAIKQDFKSAVVEYDDCIITSIQEGDVVHKGQVLECKYFNDFTNVLHERMGVWRYIKY